MVGGVVSFPVQLLEHFEVFLRDKVTWKLNLVCVCLVWLSGGSHLKIRSQVQIFFAQLPHWSWKPFALLLKPEWISPVYKSWQTAISCFYTFRLARACYAKGVGKNKERWQGVGQKMNPFPLLPLQFLFLLGQSPLPPTSLPVCSLACSIMEMKLLLRKLHFFQFL